MRKNHRSKDNFIDNIFIDIGELLCPLFKYFNFTPNMITGINIICSLLCLYYLHIKNYNLCIIFLILTFLFDCTDGSYAREYNMETYFGDLLEHYTDYIFWLWLLYILIFNIPFINRIYFIVILLILSCITLLHYGCVEHYNNAKLDINTQLSNLIKLCPNKNYIKYTRLLGGGGPLILYIALALKFYIKK